MLTEFFFSILLKQSRINRLNLRLGLWQLLILDSWLNRNDFLIILLRLLFYIVIYEYILLLRVFDWCEDFIGLLGLGDGIFRYIWKFKEFLMLLHDRFRFWFKAFCSSLRMFLVFISSYIILICFCLIDHFVNNIYLPLQLGCEIVICS